METTLSLVWTVSCSLQNLKVSLIFQEKKKKWMGIRGTFNSFKGNKIGVLQDVLHCLRNSLPLVGETISQGTGHDVNWPCQLWSGKDSSFLGFSLWEMGVDAGWAVFPLPYGSPHPIKLQHWIWHYLTGHHCTYLACHRYQRTWQILHISNQLRSDDFDFEIKVLNLKKCPNIIKIDIYILLLIHLILKVLCQNRFV